MHPTVDAPPVINSKGGVSAVDAWRYALALCREITVELGRTESRNGLQEVREDVLSILRRTCRAGLELL